MICVKFVRKLLCARQKRKHNESPISYLHYEGQVKVDEETTVYPPGFRRLPEKV